MEMIVIVRDALASSVIGSLLLAIEAKKAGQAVGVVFTQEAWPRWRRARSRGRAN